jgi:repressor LexA
MPVSGRKVSYLKDTEMKGLTPKQREILQFIQNFIDLHHYSPSYREIMDHFDLNSPGSVYKHIRTLQRKGVLIADKHCHRSLLPVQQSQSVPQSFDIQLPLIGNLSIGYPLELFVHPQMLTVPSSLVHAAENTYILQVQGDSLLDEWIQDGDLLLIEARQDIDPGEIILGLINQNDTVLKRYYPEGQNIRLESQQLHIPSLTVRYEHIQIQGVLVGMMRMYTHRE